MHTRRMIVLLGTGLLIAMPCALVAASPGAAAALPLAWPDAPTWWSGDGSFSDAVGDLEQFVGVLEQSLEQLLRWVQLFQQTASDVLTQMIRVSPGLLPDEADLTALVRQIELLPASLGRTLQAVLTKLQVPAAPGSLDERHHAYIESNPALVHEALDIAQMDEVVAGGTVQQEASSQAAAAGAAAAVRDLRPLVVSAEASATSDALASAAPDLPSSRAGIELLVAGLGSAVRQQADLGAATADRLTVLAQQNAQLSQQIEAQAATTGASTLRQAERDRRALDAQLGLADAASSVAGMLQQALAGMGDPAVDEPHLEPLY